MNDRCAVAFNNPCAEAQDTVNPAFWERVLVDGRWLSTIVTINK
jgi:hypothetical protein